MNFYALNVTPINGWAFSQAFAGADMSLVVSGVSANVVLGSGQVDMSLSPSGNGTRRTFGSADVSMTLAPTGDGTRRTFGTADVSLSLTAEGDGQVTQIVGGTATLMLTWPVGLGGIIVNGSAEVAMQLDVQGDGRAAVGRHGSGDAYMYMEVSGDGRDVVPQMGSGLVDMWIYPTAVPRLITQNGGAIDMSLVAESRERVGQRVFGAGEIGMRLEVLRDDARQYRLLQGSGRIDITLTLEPRDARIAVLPSTFYPAPKARGMRVDKESRVLRVPQPQRTFAEV